MNFLLFSQLAGNFRFSRDGFVRDCLQTGLTVRCQLDTSQYPSGIIVADAEMAAINIQRAEFHGEWNYTISPDPHRPNRAFIS